MKHKKFPFAVKILENALYFPYITMLGKLWNKAIFKSKFVMEIFP